MTFLLPSTLCMLKLPVTPMRPLKRNTLTFTVTVRSILQGQLRSILANKTGEINFSNYKPKRGYFHRDVVQISTNFRCTIIEVIFVVSNN